MRSLLAMAILLGLSAACSNQFTSPAQPLPWADSKPAASVPAKPTPAAAPNATPNANLTPVYSTTTDPGYVVLTPQMVKAGYRVLLESGITDAQVEADKLVLAEIFRAMWAQAKDEAPSNVSGED